MNACRCLHIHDNCQIYSCTLSVENSCGTFFCFWRLGALVVVCRTPGGTKVNISRNKKHNNVK
jgi:hypothetical protein